MGSTEYQEAQIAPFAPRLSTIGRVVPLDEQDDPKARILILEMSTFCRAVFPSQGTNSVQTWRMKAVIEATPRWQKFPSPKVDRHIFISGSIRGFSAAPAPSKGRCLAMVMENASYLPFNGTRPSSNPPATPGTPTARRVRRAAPEPPV